MRQNKVHRKIKCPNSFPFHQKVDSPFRERTLLVSPSHVPHPPLSTLNTASNPPLNPRIYTIFLLHTLSFSNPPEQPRSGKVTCNPCLNLKIPVSGSNRKQADWTTSSSFPWFRRAGSLSHHDCMLTVLDLSCRSRDA